MPTNDKNIQTSGTNKPKLKIQVISFAYKSNSPPKANLLFDVRFIDNPFWVEDLKPLNGLDKKVQDFVLGQDVSQQFLNAFKQMVKMIIPLQAASVASKIGTPSEVDTVFTIAFGCTGGWHRSVAVSGEAARLIGELFPDYSIEVVHREIASTTTTPATTIQAITEETRP
jgi:RNase adapter protein RapZ